MEIEKWIHFDQINSTSSWLKDHYQSLPVNRTLVWAKEQSAGRGRFERIWKSPPGGLYFSVLLLPDLEKIQPEELVISFSEFLIEFAREKWGLNFWMKPPNDVYYRDRKLSGILIENIFLGEKLEACVFGVGLNVNQRFDSQVAEVSGYFPVSLGEILERNIELEGLLKEMVGKWQPPLS